MARLTLQELREDYEREKRGLSKEQERRIEGMLFNYPFFEVAIEDARRRLEDLYEDKLKISAAPTDEAIPSSGKKGYQHSDKTGQAAAAIADDPRAQAIKRDIKHHEKQRNSVARILAFLEEWSMQKERKFIELKYFERYGVAHICKELGLHTKKYYRFRKEVLHRCGQLKGWL